jgi:hypothetical protein
MKNFSFHQFLSAAQLVDKNRYYHPVTNIIEAIVLRVQGEAVLGR